MELTKIFVYIMILCMIGGSVYLSFIFFKNKEGGFAVLWLLLTGLLIYLLSNQVNNDLIKKNVNERADTIIEQNHK